MQLFYSTGTGSMACVIAIEEAGIPCELTEVSFRRNVQVDALDRAHALGRVPTLVLDDGRVLTQTVAILEHLADMKPEARLLPPAGTWERAQARAWTLFMNADLQRAFALAFQSERVFDDAPSQQRMYEYGVEAIRENLAWVDESLRGRAFLAADHFTVADGYLAFLLTWCDASEIPLDAYPEILRWRKATLSRPGVTRALAREDG